MGASLTTVRGGTVDFSDEQLVELGMQFRGPIFSPGDPGFDEHRAVENLAIDRRPGLIIRCSGEADVIDGVKLARDQGLVLAVRGGGHHVAGHATVDGGLVLDMRDMNGVWVDPVNKTVRVQGGATWGQVDREAQVFGLAIPGGVVSTTGVGGLTLGGGIGWLHRKYGLTSDNLIGAQVVLASGQLVDASEHEHPDLFWAIRGGGGNFGVVVDFTFRSHEVGPVSDEDFVIEPRSFVARSHPERFTDKDGVLAGMQDTGCYLLNALTEEQHQGTGGVHYGRPGRISGSVNVPAQSLVDPETHAYLPLESLRQKFADAGALDARSVITYCGGGIAASSAAFVLALLGKDDVVVYDASMSEWASDSSLPMEAG